MSEEKTSQISGYVIFYAVVAIVLGVAGAAGAKQVGIISRIFIFIFGTAGAFCGAFVGDWLRKIAMPDSIITSGMADTLKQKLFWFIGPQMIGEILGMGLGGGIILAIVK